MRWNNKLFHQPQAIADIILKCYTQAFIVIVKKCVGVGEESSQFFGIPVPPRTPTDLFLHLMQRELTKDETFC